MLAIQRVTGAATFELRFPTHALVIHKTTLAIPRVNGTATLALRFLTHALVCQPAAGIGYP